MAYEKCSQGRSFGSSRSGSAMRALDLEKKVFTSRSRVWNKISRIEKKTEKREEARNARSCSITFRCRLSHIYSPLGTSKLYPSLVDDTSQHKNLVGVYCSRSCLQLYIFHNKHIQTAYNHIALTRVFGQGWGLGDCRLMQNRRDGA